jgi:hypothetical protein
MVCSFGIVDVVTPLRRPIRPPIDIADRDLFPRPGRSPEPLPSGGRPAAGTMPALPSPSLRPEDDQLDSASPIQKVGRLGVTLSDTQAA